MGRFVQGTPGRAVPTWSRVEERGSAMHTVGILLVVVLLAVAVAVERGVLPDLSDEAGTGTEPVSPPATVPGLALSDPGPPPAVLDPANGQDSPPTAGEVRQALAAALSDRSLGRHVAVSVADLEDGRSLWASGRPRIVTPASTLKLLTTTAALATMGAEHRFTTSVTPGRTRNQVILVGGGSPLLTVAVPPSSDPYPRPATLRDLARQTAAALRSRGATRVRLGYDASLFTGPAVNPHWEPSYVPESVVTPISALWIDEGREVAGYAQRVTDPARFAAQAFATQLERFGVRVRSPIRPAKAADGTRPLAAVESPPLAAIVQHVLEVSDNEGAEVLLRQVAIATGAPGSAAAGVRAVRRVLAEHGVDLSGARIYDGSGLSRDDRLPIGALTQVLHLAATGDPALRSVVTGLPVAGFTGSLAYRFVESAPTGLGFVRAKTGTLSGVHGLAGIATDPSGDPLAFAVVADRVRLPQTLDARDALDEAASALVGCC
jgi:D-alanyl-D-alanine carboxypeptidase/D-alanyl-D-alanine-endopeptidase (penicillin-binding protein 4)